MSIPSVRGRPYWTAERLKWLIAQLQSFAHQDEEGWFFAQEGLQAELYARLHSLGYAYNAFVPPIRILVHLGVLAPGKRGGKNASSRRSFYPEKASLVTPEAVAAYHRSVGARYPRKKNEATDA